MSQTPVRWDRRYWTRLLVLALAAILVPVVMVPLLIGAGGVWGLTHPPCLQDGSTPADYKLDYREITIPSQSGLNYHGFFIPGTKDALVIVVPAYTNTRGGMLHEGALIAQHGFSVLTYESGICAGKTVSSLGYAEVDEVGDVLAYLKKNPDNLKVNMSRIALHGFSSAGATSTMAAARYPEIYAVLAEGGYHNMDDAMGYNNANKSFVESLMSFGARATYRLSTGLDPALLSPIDAIKKIPPRPIFLVYGSQEVSLPGAKEQFAAVKSVDPNARIQLWIVRGSGHGGYIPTVGVDEYKRWVLPFYDCALLDQCTQWDALWKSP